MPPPPAPRDPVLRFGRFALSPAERLLRVDSVPAALGARAFDVLLALVERRGRLVPKQELLDLVWPGVVVEEHNIAAQVSSLRKLLGPQVIATVPGRGYRFVAALDEAAPDAPAPPRDATPGGLALPEPRTRFIGREAALAELARLLPQTRLLTLTGIGGCGKTRLALQLARERAAGFAGGACFVDLTPLKDADRVAAACAAALGLAPGAEAFSAERAAAQVAGRAVLIVLDNCEHVRDGAAAFADALLSRAGPSRIVATSREPLSVAGEQLYPVRPLALPAGDAPAEVAAAEAVRVFVDRVRLMQPEFEVDDDNAGAVAAICRRLDGLALALELAAARVPVLSVREIASRLHDRFRLLAGHHAAAAHRQTLLATMQWSHDLLDPAQQRMLRRLAVCAGGCTLAGAAAIAGVDDEYEALSLLGALNDKSLLVIEGAAARGGARPPRYRMLETVAQYAAERLEEAGEVEAARARHAAFFLALAEQAAPHLRGPQQSHWMARLRDEQENLVAAFAFYLRPGGASVPRQALRLAGSTARYWVFNEVELGWRLLSEALALDDPATPCPERLPTLLGLASLATHRGLGNEGLPHAREALALAEQLGSLEWQALAHSGIGTCLSRADEEEQALRCFERAMELAQQANAVVPLAAALNNIAAIEMRLGRLEAAERGFRRALHVVRAQGDVRAALIFLHNLVRVCVAAGKAAAARDCAREAERLLREVDDEVLKLELLEVGAGLASLEAQHAQAARFWGATMFRFAAAGYSRPPEDQQQLERLLAQTRQAMGEEAFALAEAEGRSLRVEAAMRELAEWLERGDVRPAAPAAAHGRA